MTAGVLVLFGLFLLLLVLIFSFVLPYKISSKNKVRNGFLGFVFVFVCLFGIDLYKYIEFRFICLTQSEDKIYDQEAYERFKKADKENNVIILKKQELVDFMKEHNINNYLTLSAIYDPINNYHINQIINLTNGDIIKKRIDYSGRGSWFTKLLSASAMSNSFGSCEGKGLGAFKEHKGWGLTF